MLWTKSCCLVPGWGDSMCFICSISTILVLIGWAELSWIRFWGWPGVLTSQNMPSWAEWKLVVWWNYHPVISLSSSKIAISTWFTYGDFPVRCVTLPEGILLFLVVFSYCGWLNFPATIKGSKHHSFQHCSFLVLSTNMSRNWSQDLASFTKILSPPADGNGLLGTWHNISWCQWTWGS